jgi:hypothetical protein
LHDDLATAVKMALGATRAQARERALDFSWPEATALFLDNLTLIKK